MTITEEGKLLIKEYEKCKLTSYLCPAKKWTIGWGNTFYESGEPVRSGQTITQERADRLFNNILLRFQTEVRQVLKVELNENQFSALLSFTWNVGTGNLRSSTLLKLINQGDFDKASGQFERWVYSGKKKLKGLERRRESERQLFVKEP